MICPVCGKESPDGFEFCGFCGAPLAEREPTLAQEERKVVSILFCDLVGFTASSEQLDPEDVRARLQPYHERVRDVLTQHGGTVEKFIGDAVMAVFGAPVAHEDDAERAVRAGLRILEAIGELNESDPSLDLHVRVGVNTGEAVVALAARAELGEGFVAGDVVNTAARLQSSAPVDGVAVSEATYRATERVFDVEPLEPVLVKGKAEALRMWHVLQPRARFGSDVTRSFTSPLVGRDLERSLLTGTLERAAAQRSCQLVTIVGEPGVGKSRLCAELLAYVDERPGLVRWRQGRCLPYGDGIAFWALAEIVKSECGILDTDSPAQSALKLERAIAPQVADRPWLLARLGPLVGVPSEPVAQEESFVAWRTFLELLASEGPCVLVVEDLHWADGVLLSFLEHLADWVQGVPLLVLASARPELYERHPHFGADARNSQRINLAPLSDEETAHLIAALLHQTVLPAALEQTLLERAGGNPLYAEEFVRLLADRELLVAPDELSLPESLQSLIAARLDTLPLERKALLQDAAVVGKVFWSGAVAEMGNRDPGEVERILHELGRKELVRPSRTSSMHGQREYSFWHALVRDVCYLQIPRSGRAAKHGAAAAWIERQAGEGADDLADVLAYHYGSALALHQAGGVPSDLDELDLDELRGLTVRNLVLAGERALQLDAASAEATFARALELAGPDQSWRARVLEGAASVALYRGRLSDADRAVEEARSIYRAAGDTVAAARTLRESSVLLQAVGDTDGGLAMALESLALLQALPPGDDHVSAHTQLAAMSTVSGRYVEAIEAADEAISLARRLGHEEPARALGYRGKGRAVLGDAGGLVDMRRALALALARTETRDAAVLYNNLALELWPWEGPASALAASTEGLDFCTRRGLTTMGAAIATQNLTFLFDLGRTRDVVATAGPLADEGDATGNFSVRSEARANLLLAVIRTGTGTEATCREARELCDLVRPTGEPQNIAPAYTVAAEALLARGLRDEARTLLAELVAAFAVPVDPYHVANLPALVRCALLLPDLELAEALAAGLEPLAPQARYVLESCSAQLIEGRGENRRAADAYREAAAGWARHGNVPEQAYALLGRARCLHAIGEAAAPCLTEARSLFAAADYAPSVAAIDTLLANGV